MWLYNELKRRNVLRVGAAYVVATWLLIQIAETIFPLFGFDDTPARIVVIVLAIGFYRRCYRIRRLLGFSLRTFMNNLAI